MSTTPLSSTAAQKSLSTSKQTTHPILETCWPPSSTVWRPIHNPMKSELEHWQKVQELFSKNAKGEDWADENREWKAELERLASWSVHGDLSIDTLDGLLSDPSDLTDELRRKYQNVSSQYLGHTVETDDELDRLIRLSLTLKDDKQKDAVNETILVRLGLDEFGLEHELEKFVAQSEKLGDNESRKEFAFIIKKCVQAVKVEVKKKLMSLNQRLEFLITRAGDLERENNLLRKISVVKLFSKEVDQIKLTYDKSLITTNDHWTKLVNMLQRENAQLHAKVSTLEARLAILEKRSLEMESIQVELAKVKEEKKKLEFKYAALYEELTSKVDFETKYRRLQDYYLILRVLYINLVLNAAARENSFQKRLEVIQTKSTLAVELLDGIGERAVVVSMEATWAHVQAMFKRLVDSKSAVEIEFRKQERVIEALKADLLISERKVLWLKRYLRISAPQVHVDEELAKYEKLLEDGEVSLSSLSLWSGRKPDEPLVARPLNFEEEVVLVKRTDEVRETAKADTVAKVDPTGPKVDTTGPKTSR